MRTLGDQLSLVEDQNAISAADRGEAVRDDQHRAVVPNRIQSILDQPFTFPASRLAVASSEQQERRVLDQGPGNRDPLPLPTRQAQSALAQIGVVAVRQPVDEFIGMRGSRGLPQAALHSRNRDA